MMLPARDPAALAGERFDVAIVGGGVYGAMLALESVRHGLRPLLLDRGDFAAATSFNSLRIIHGGLRYLQTANVPRAVESIREQRWFLRTFPDFVEPLPSLMPLYNVGVRRTWIMRAALAADGMLAVRRNAGVTPARQLSPARVVDAAKVCDMFPGVDTKGLRGGALWYDAFAPDAPLLIREIIRWACADGAAALSYMEATGVHLVDGQVRGVTARDECTGAECTFAAGAIINAAGPWSRAFSATCGDERPELFTPALAWNVVFDREPPAACALALQPARTHGQTYFVVPWKGVTFAGTAYAPWTGTTDAPYPGLEQLRTFVADLNAALPGMALREGDIARVTAGIMPVRRAGSVALTTRDVIVDHGATGGPRGLFSVSGVKLSTARAVAEATVRRAFPHARPCTDAALPRPESIPASPHRSFRWMPDPGDPAWQREFEELVRAEPVVHLADVFLRRSTLGDNPERALALAPAACRLLGWDAARTREETAALACAVRGEPVGGAPVPERSYSSADRDHP